MDFLNKTFAQFNDLFRTMTPGARITAGLLLTVVVISLVYLFSYQISSNDIYLMDGRAFQPEQKYRIQVALGAKKLSCTVDGAMIKIPRGREAEYMTAIAEGNAIPAGWGDPDKSISNGSVWEDRDTRKMRAKNDLERKLGFLVSSFPNVENAAVTYDKSSSGGFRKKVSICASVAVQPTGENIELSKRTVASIRNMVASAISPMNPADVTVVNLGTGTSYAADSEAQNGSFGLEYLEKTRDWEENYTDKIGNLLSRVDGVKVAVTVRLDPTESMAATTFTPDKKQTATVTTTTKELNRDHKGAASGGRPGFTANQPGAIRNTVSKGSEETESESESTTTNLVGQTHETKKSVGMTPEWVAASVVVPYSYLVKVWNEENPTAEGEEAKQPETKDIQPIEQRVIAQIKEVVAGVLPDGMQGVTDKLAQVKVTVDRDIKPAPLPAPAMTSKAMAWLSSNWQMIGLVVLAFASLGILRSMVKSTPLESPVAQQPGPTLAAETGAPVNDVVEEGMDRQQRRLARFAAGGASLRDELAELVGEDPDAAANILQTWIGNPGIKV